MLAHSVDCEIYMLHTVCKTAHEPNNPAKITKIEMMGDSRQQKGKEQQNSLK